MISPLQAVTTRVITVDPINTLHNPSRDGEFVRLMTLYQPDIYAYLRSLMFVADEAADVLQDTNLVLWEKREQFESGTDFRAWAFQIARYKLLQHHTQNKRQGLSFSESLVDELAIQASSCLTVDDDPIGELRQCLAKLPPKDRELILQRYAPLATCESIAAAVGRPFRWVYRSLSRIRRELIDCVTRYSTTRRGQ